MRATVDGTAPHPNATIEALTRELQEAHSTIEALTRREIDAVSSESGDVVLLAAAQHEIITREAWYRALFEASPLPTIVHDVDSRQIMAVNPATIDQYGYTRDELLSMKIDELRSTGERDHIARVLAQAEIAGRATGTWSHRRKDGALISVEVVAQQVEFNGRRAWLTICADVTRRLAQQHALRASEESLKTMLNSIGDAVIATDVTGRIVRMNPVAERLTGWTELAARRQPVEEIVQLTDRETGKPVPSLVVGAVSSGGVMPRRDSVLRSRKGQVHSIATSAASIRDEEGRLSGVVMVLRDVSAERAAHDALRKSEAGLANAHRLAKLGQWEWDITRDRISVGPASFLREPLPGELRTKDEILALVHPGDRERVRNAIDNAVQGNADYDVVYRRLTTDGRPIVLRSVGEVIFEGGRPIRMVGMFQDITEQHAMQARLALADRMASVGTLAAGVAHEINNPLAYVMASADLARTALAERPEMADRARISEAAEAMASVQEGCERIRLIVRDLKTFSRTDDERVDPVDIRRALESALAMAAVEIRHRARLVRDLHEVPPVLGNEGRLGQVFLNLIINAAQAITEGAADRNEIRIATRCDAFGRVVVEVADSGSGIPAESLPHIFEPFFTTKPVGQGTGLGLSICHGIVTGLGGEILAEARPAGGTVFRVVLLPFNGQPLVEQTSKSPEQEKYRGRLIVIDDEPSLLAALKRALSREQNEVIGFGRATDALAFLESGQSCDAILCDLMMPEMTGMDLHEVLGRIRPELLPRMLFLSGGVFTQRAREFLGRPGIQYLEKPFELPILFDAIGRLLQAARAHREHGRCGASRVTCRP